MASVNLDDICTDCLSGKHCGGNMTWCSCCSTEDNVGPVKRRRKEKPRDGEWQ